MSKKEIKKIIIIALIAFIFLALLIKLDTILLFFSKLATITIPIIIGIVIAFILNGTTKKIHKIIIKIIPKLKNKNTYLFEVIFSYIFVLGILIGLSVYVVPQIKNSIILFSYNFNNYYSNFTKYYDKLVDNDTFGLLETLNKMLSEISINLPSIIEKTYNFTSGLILSVSNTFIGIIISIYILLDKIRLKEMCSSFFKALLNEKKYKFLKKYYMIVTDSFTKFFNGQIIEAVILAVLCFLGMTILGFEYAPLISTLIGITALIPVVGAFLGTIPSALILMLVKPIDAVWFIIFIIILQQIEGNFIYPRVVGKTVGLPPLLVLLSIIIGAGLGGIGGILLGVPLMSVLYILFKDYVSTHRYEYNIENNNTDNNDK